MLYSLFWEALRNLLVEKVLRKSRVVDCVVKLGGEEGVQLVLYFPLQLFTELVIRVQLEWLRADEVRQQVLVAYQAVHLVTDCTALRPTQVFMSVEV